MAACDPQTFANFTQARFDCLAQNALAATGVHMSANEGEATKRGITLRWKFDPAAQTLEVQCLAHPFIVTCDFVNQKIQEMVSGCP